MKLDTGPLSLELKCAISQSHKALLVQWHSLLVPGSSSLIQAHI